MLVKLASPSTSPVARINTDPNIPATDQDVTAMGFGRIGADQVASWMLLHVNVSVFDQTICRQNYFWLAGNFPPIHGDNSQICAGDETGERDACFGDSGSPLVDVNDPFLQHGIVSAGPIKDCAVPELPGIYTRTSHYADWIQKGICCMSDDPPPECMAQEQRDHHLFVFGSKRDDCAEFR